MKKSRFDKKKRKKEIIDTKALKLKKTWYGSIFYFIWYDDSILSWIVNIILAFLIIKYLFYPGLSLVLGTNLPVVAVVSCSMEHKFTNCGVSEVNGQPNPSTLCGETGSGKVDFDVYWRYCGDFYENINITKDEFKEFSFSSGFNKGDIMLLIGVKPENIEIGDVIVFEANQKTYPVIHRTITKDKIDGEYFIGTKGDHNFDQIKHGEFTEVDITRDQILGKAFLRIPFLGYVKIYFVELISLFMPN
jgi:hypothetical protein